MKKKTNKTKVKVQEKNKIENVGSFDTDLSKIIYIVFYSHTINLNFHK